MLLDVIETKDPAGGGDIQRAVMHADAIRHIEAAGDHQDAIGPVVAVPIDERVDFAGEHRPDEDGAPRTERHVASVLHAVGEHRHVESCGNDPMGRCLSVQSPGSCRSQDHAGERSAQDSLLHRGVASMYELRVSKQ